MLKAQRRQNCQNSQTPQRKSLTASGRRLSRGSSALRRLSTPKNAPVQPIPMREIRKPRPSPHRSRQSQENKPLSTQACDPLGLAGIFGNAEDRLSLTPKQSSKSSALSSSNRRDSIFGQPLRVKVNPTVSGTPRRGAQNTPSRGITPAKSLNRRLSSSFSSERRLSTPRNTQSSADPEKEALLASANRTLGTSATPLRSSSNPGRATSKHIPMEQDDEPAPPIPETIPAQSNSAAFTHEQMAKLQKIRTEEIQLMKQLARLQKARQAILDTMI